MESKRLSTSSLHRPDKFLALYFCDTVQVLRAEEEVIYSQKTCLRKLVGKNEWMPLLSFTLKDIH